VLSIAVIALFMPQDSQPPEIVLWLEALAVAPA
jgi:hypothetical protein